METHTNLNRAVVSSNLTGPTSLRVPSRHSDSIRQRADKHHLRCHVHDATFAQMWVQNSRPDGGNPGLFKIPYWELESRQSVREGFLFLKYINIHTRKSKIIKEGIYDEVHYRVFCFGYCCVYIFHREDCG